MHICNICVFQNRLKQQPRNEAEAFRVDRANPGAPAGRQRIHLILHNRADQVELSPKVRHELFTTRQREFSMPLNHTDIALTAEDLAICHQKDYWISPVLFDDEEAQTMRRDSNAMH